jgi:Putative metal-binding motif
MNRASWSLVGVSTAAALLGVAPHAFAKRTGMNLACHNCHEGRNAPQISVALSAVRVEPGQPVTVTVTAKHALAKVGGVMIDSHESGAFELVDQVGTRFYDNAKTTLVTHAMPQTYANGQVQFSFRWIAPATVGATQLEVWSNAGNDNLKPEDDSAGEQLAGVSVGCDAAWYYTDSDKDGAGAEQGRVFSCTPVADRISKGGDCNDQNPLINPAAVELCNSVDDDCDGVPDDGLMPMLLVEDADGDGYGNRSGMSMIGCPPVANFAPTFDDCNDRDANVHPGAAEVVNGRDDNCNAQTDEAVTPAMPANPSAPLGTAAPVDDGCAFAAPTRLRGIPLFGTGLVLVWVGVRRIGRRARLQA